MKFLEFIQWLAKKIYSGCNMGTSKTDYIELRKAMVGDQIEARGIKDRKVLDAMLKVPRHRFVPEDMVGDAYEDRALPIGYDQTISQPYIVAFMTEALKLTRDDVVLEIGTGSGYQAAVLAEIVQAVYTFEIVKPLADRAEGLLKELGYANIHIRYGDGYQGWEEHSPFDAVIVTCSPNHIPEPLKQQLKIGGRMIIPVGKYWDTQVLVSLEKKDAVRLVEREVLLVRFVPMTGEAEI